MTKSEQQFDALIEFVKDMISASVHDPDGGGGCARDAEKRFRAAFPAEPTREVRAGDYVDVGGEPGLAVYPPHVLVLWQNRRTSLVPLGAVDKTSAAPVGIGVDDLTEARKLGPGGSAQNRPAEPTPDYRARYEWLRARVPDNLFGHVSPEHFDARIDAAIRGEVNRPAEPAAPEPVYECCNDACPWRGPLSETVHPKHEPEHLLCPECYEVVEAQ